MAAVFKLSVINFANAIAVNPAMLSDWHQSFQFNHSFDEYSSACVYDLLTIYVNNVTVSLLLTDKTNTRGKW